MRLINQIVNQLDRLGSWRVLAYAGQKGQYHFAWCVCECGEVKKVNASNLIHGYSRNCGCVRRKTLTSKTHGMSKQPEYRAWKAMLSRASVRHSCPNERNKKHYRDKGITVFAEWVDDFEKFYAHIGPMPEGKNTLDRIDGARGYEPGNVKWASWREQAQNTSRNKLVTIDGVTLCVTEWARRLNIGLSTVKYRVRHGRSIEDALTVKPDLGGRWNFKKDAAGKRTLVRQGQYN